MALLDRSRRQPRNPRRAVLAGSPAFPASASAEAPADEKPKKRTARKKASPKPEAKDE